MCFIPDLKFLSQDKLQLTHARGVNSSSLMQGRTTTTGSRRRLNPTLCTGMVHEEYCILIFTASSTVGRAAALGVWPRAQASVSTGVSLDCQFFSTRVLHFHLPKISMLC